MQRCLVGIFMGRGILKVAAQHQHRWHADHDHKNSDHESQTQPPRQQAFLFKPAQLRMNSSFC